MACVLVLLSQSQAEADAFPLSGRYNFLLNGFVLVDLDNDPNSSQFEAVPTSAVGWIAARRNGNVPNVRYTFNIGGCLVLDSSGSGTYNSNGRDRNNHGGGRFDRASEHNEYRLVR
jgi:hypothetical protein